MPAATFRSKGVCLPMYTSHFTFFGPSQYFSSFRARGWRVKNFHFFRIHCHLQRICCDLLRTHFWCHSQTADFRISYASAVNLSYLETILVHPTRLQKFAGSTQLSATSETLSLERCIFAYGCLVVTWWQERQEKTERQEKKQRNWRNRMVSWEAHERRKKKRRTLNIFK